MHEVRRSPGGMGQIGVIQLDSTQVGYAVNFCLFLTAISVYFLFATYCTDLANAIAAPGRRGQACADPTP